MVVSRRCPTSSSSPSHSTLPLCSTPSGYLVRPIYPYVNRHMPARLTCCVSSLHRSAFARLAASLILVAHRPRRVRLHLGKRSSVCPPPLPHPHLPLSDADFASHLQLCLLASTQPSDGSALVRRPRVPYATERERTEAATEGRAGCEGVEGREGCGAGCCCCGGGGDNDSGEEGETS